MLIGRAEVIAPPMDPRLENKSPAVLITPKRRSCTLSDEYSAKIDIVMFDVNFIDSRSSAAIREQKAKLYSQYCTLAIPVLV